MTDISTPSLVLFTSVLAGFIARDEANKSMVERVNGLRLAGLNLTAADLEMSEGNN